MTYLRVLLTTNAVLVLLIGIAGFSDWWSNPGNWSRSRIEAELAKSLPADQVTLMDDGKGGYRGEAHRGSAIDYRLRVWRDVSNRAMHWEAIRGDGRKVSGKKRHGIQFGRELLAFASFVNIAVAAIVAGAQCTASMKNIWVRDLLGYLGFAIFVVGAVFGLPYDRRSIDELPWNMWIAKWLCVGVTFFGFGMMSRHVYALGRSPKTSQSAREHKEADCGDG